MKLVLLHCTQSKEEWIKNLTLDYIKKMSFFYPFEVIVAKPSKQSRDDKEYKKGEDSNALLKLLKPDDYVILFDEKGVSLDSMGFSQKINQALNSSKKRICFVIGGAYGASDELKERSELKVSFSKMTMNHLIAQAVALEQIYRGVCILKNYPYHNE